MTSFRFRLTVWFMRLTRGRRIFNSPAGLLRAIEKTRRWGAAGPGRRLARRMHVARDVVEGREVYRLRPRHAASASARVLYLHGGAYVFPITRLHWRMLSEIVQATGLELIVPLYPLAPESSGPTGMTFVENLYRSEAAGGMPILLMGDSAGAGLALALASALRDTGVPRPRGLILIAPWLDVELQHPDSVRVAHDDPVLDLPGAREAGRLYAGPLATSHPWISPARGAPMEDLPPITIFIGTRDIVAADAIAFARAVKAKGGVVDLRIAHGMIHAWPLFAFPEARRAREEIAAVARSAAGDPAPQRVDSR